MSQPITFWEKIAQTPTLYQPNAPVIVQEKKLGDKAQDLQKEMFASCTLAEKYAQEFFKKPPPRVLDLGSGIGANSRPMTLNGAHVTAIDNSRELLEKYSELSQKDGCPARNIRLLRGDITKIGSYGKDFDLVVAVDILPYIAPKDLFSTMQKVHACLLDKGILVGTIFTTVTDPMARLLMGQVGAHFYEDESDFTRNLLENSGFSLEKLEATGSGYRFKAIKKEVG